MRGPRWSGWIRPACTRRPWRGPYGRQAGPLHPCTSSGPYGRSRIKIVGRGRDVRSRRYRYTRPRDTTVVPAMKSARLPVLEVMTSDPVTAVPDLTVAQAASVMRDRGVGSLIVVEGGKAVGILTERDIVTKVAAEDRKASTLKVRDVMTSPVVSVHPHEEVEEAARRMSKRRIRRLPVVQDGKLLGVITENDILRVWPHLVEVTREWARAGMFEEGPGPVEGHCDSCGVYSTQLMRDGKLLLGPECRER